MKRDRIHSAGPWITDREIAYVTDAVTNGWYSHYRDYVQKFEQAFAQYVGVKYALATTCGTAALHLAVAAAGIGPGDEVIVPDISWVATANVVKYLGAEPVFVDVDPDSWTMDPQAARRAVTPRTRALFPVHLYGHPADMAALTDLAEEKGLLVIEDAAPAVGSRFQDRMVGTFGLAAGFSFQGAKMMITGEGGMFVTNDEASFRRAESLIEHGRDDSKGMFYSAEIGYQYTMANLLAALGLAQLERVGELIERKRRLFDWYHQRLGRLEGLSLFKEKPGCFSNCSYPSILVDPKIIGLDELRLKLRERGIDTRPVFPRLSPFPAFGPADTPVARRVAETGLNLPTAAYLDEEDVEDVCAAIREITGL